jgi:16S rRNA (uracil1498-N3)-methyltransferase
MAHRLGRVLRLRRGDRAVLFDGGPREYEVELTGVSGNAVTALVAAERPAPPEPAARVVLYQSLVRSSRFDLVLEKGTEIGVARFLPLLAARSRVQDDHEPSTVRAERWRRITVEAAEQSGRGRVPEVGAPAAFDDALRGAKGLRILPWEGARLQGLTSYLRSLPDRPREVSLFVGPEGGFEPEEVALARHEGAVLVTLGPRILRSETAGIVAAALVLDALGEMG